MRCRAAGPAIGDAWRGTRGGRGGGGVRGIQFELEKARFGHMPEGEANGIISLGHLIEIHQVEGAVCVERESSANVRQSKSTASTG